MIATLSTLFDRHPWASVAAALVLSQVVLGWSRSRVHRFILLVANLACAPIKHWAQRLRALAEQMRGAAMASALRV